MTKGCSVPTHRQSGRALRHRRSHGAPSQRRAGTRRYRFPPTRKGWAAALGALLVAGGAGAFLASHVHHNTGPATYFSVTAADSRNRRAASRDRNRLATTPPAAPPTAPPANGSPPPRPAIAATVRPSIAPSPSRAAAPAAASPAVPAGCSGYAGNQLIACTLLPSFGFALSEMPPLVNLWNGESGWNTTATNPSSGAYGIPQALPADKMASAGADWQTNPATQIRWGLGSIKSVYGTPTNAWAMWQSRSPHWY
jgi:hypothetical protein